MPKSVLVIGADPGGLTPNLILAKTGNTINEPSGKKLVL
jgi:heterodisulfide reductase subunit A-like polyferredoxin